MLSHGSCGEFFKVKIRLTAYFQKAYTPGSFPITNDLLVFFFLFTDHIGRINNFPIIFQCDCHLCVSHNIIYSRLLHSNVQNLT